jgi:hypothetical protein
MNLPLISSQTFTNLELKKSSKKNYKTKEYKCYRCDVSFTRPSWFKQHKLSKSHIENTGNIPINQKYKCDLCDVTTRQRKKLEEHHEKKHPGKVPYICNICDRGFLYAKNKTKHYKGHHQVDSLLNSSIPKAISNDSQSIAQENNQYNSSENITYNNLSNIKQNFNKKDISPLLMLATVAVEIYQYLD